jgi:hypothetical protein
VKSWIEEEEPTQSSICKRVQMRFIELRDNVIEKLGKSGVFLESSPSQSSSEQAPQIKTVVLNKGILSDLSKLKTTISEGLLGIGVNNNVFEAMNKTRTDILQKIEKSENSGLDQSNQIMELMNQMFLD